jgi:hypothetical protein
LHYVFFAGTPLRVMLRATAVLVGCAVLVNSPGAQAEPVDMAPQHYSKQFSDGWNLQLNITSEVINSVPNLAAAQNSREAFVTFAMNASATGGAAPISDSVFVAGYQMGCQTDVSSGLQIGGVGSVAPLASVSAAGPNVGVGLGLSGFVQTILQPGVIVDLPLSNMALNKEGKAMLNVDNIHIKADACGGDVTVRSYAYLRIANDQAHDQIAIYGDPMKI